MNDGQQDYSDLDVLSKINNFSISEMSTLFPDIYEKHVGELYGEYLEDEKRFIDKLIHENEYNLQKHKIIKEIKDRYLYNKIKSF